MTERVCEGHWHASPSVVCVSDLHDDRWQQKLQQNRQKPPANAGSEEGW